MQAVSGAWRANHDPGDTQNLHYAADCCMFKSSALTPINTDNMHKSFQHLATAAWASQHGQDFERAGVGHKQQQGRRTAMPYCTVVCRQVVQAVVAVQRCTPNRHGGSACYRGFLHSSWQWMLFSLMALVGLGMRT